MRTFFLIYLILISTSLAQAQSEYRPGYIITNDNEIIQGFIGYLNGDIAYNKCRFKIAKESKPIDYSPNEIKAYQFDGGRLYKSKRYFIDEKKETVEFLRVLVAGKISLYKSNSYFVEKDFSFYELITTEEIIKINGVEKVRENNAYLGILSFMISDCGIPLSKSLSLTESDLTKLIIKYNKCSGVDFILYKEERAGFKINLGVELGVKTSSPFLTTYISKKTTSLPFRNSLNPTFGIRLGMLSPRINDRLSFETGALINPMYLYSSFADTTSSATIYNDVHINYLQFNLPLGIQYIFNSRKLQPFFNAGVIVTLNINPDFKWVREEESGQAVNTSIYTEQDLNTFSKGAWCGAGFQLKFGEKLNGLLQVRHEWLTGILDSNRFMPNNEIVVEDQLRSWNVSIGLIYR